MDNPAEKPAVDAAAPATDASTGSGPSDTNAKAPVAAAAAAAEEVKSVEAPRSAVIPFVEALARDDVRKGPDITDPRPARFDRLLAYGSHAALIVALVGFAWAISGHFRTAAAPPAVHTVAKAAPDPQAQAIAKDRAERAEMHRTTQAMATEIRALKTSIEGLRASAARNPTADEVRFLEKSLDGLKSKLDLAKNETAASLAQLSGKLEHVQQEPVAKLREVAERLDRIEKQTAAPLTTGSLPKVAVATVNPTPIPLPPAKRTLAPQAQAAVDALKKPQLITAWVVRDVYDGIALVESSNGAIEVVPGETIPGAGTVKSIERRGAGWIVVTTKGLVDFARN